MFSSKFIKASESYCTYENNVNAPYIRKTFTLDKVPVGASLTLTCTGFYRLWINGAEITKSRLAPCITNFDDIIFYDKYDVAQYLTEGKNCIAMLLGNGFSNNIGGYIWDFDKALLRSAPKVALHFEADGAESFEADESFKCKESPIYFDDLRSGEFYDANLEINGWNEPQFDDSGWRDAIKTDPARGEARLNETDPIVVTKELKAEKIYSGRVVETLDDSKVRPDSANLSKTSFYKPDKDEEGVVYEFSENTACVPRLRIRGRKGQRIIIQCAEYCTEEGEVSFRNINSFYPFGFCQRDIYVCKGEGIEEYIPSFTYHGARYFLIIGADKEQITDDLVTMLVTNSDIKTRGDFKCSDPIASALQRNTRTSDLANFVYFPTDCPHREKNGWTGDASMSAEQMTQNFAIERSCKQWLRMIAASQRSDGALPGIVPTTGWGFAWGNGPVWDQVIVEIPYVTYLYRGTTELFEICSDAVIRYLNYISKKRRKDGLIAIGLGDWCHAFRHDTSLRDLLR